MIGGDGCVVQGQINVVIGRRGVKGGGKEDVVWGSGGAGAGVRNMVNLGETA